MNIRNALLALLLPVVAAPASGQDYGVTTPDSTVSRVVTVRATDTAVNQRWTSEFGYSILLPSIAKYNKIGSVVNAQGRTEKQNFMLPGGNGSITLYHYVEPRMVPKDYKLLDSMHFYQYDSLGRNGMIHRRIYVLHEQSVMIEILLTEKGEKALGALVPAIFDSFVPPPGATFALENWRYGRDPREYQQGRYGKGTGPGHQ